MTILRAESLLTRITGLDDASARFPQISILPNRSLLAAVDVPPEKLLSLLSYDDLVDRVVVEPERYLYLYEPKEHEYSSDQPGWHLDACWIGPHSPTGKGVAVAVLDSGFDRSHPDFPNRVQDDDFVSFIGETADDQDDHGTHCAGVIGGPKESKSGIRYGVAPDTRLIIGRVINKNLHASFEWDLLEALLWAHCRGADIISLSLGVTQSPCDPSSLIFNIITSILLDTGTIIVAAAGNSSDRKNCYERPIHHPADSCEMLTVAALDAKLRVWNSSCPSICGQKNPSIAQPGQNIYSAIPVRIGLETPFGRKAGTSGATAIAAGLAALWAEATGARGRALLDLLQRRPNVMPLSDKPEDVGRGMLKAP